MVKAFCEWLLINTCEAGGRGKYEEELALRVARSTAAERANFPCWQRHNGSRAVQSSACAHKLYVLAVPPGRLC